MITKISQFICGLHGHDALLHFENSRMSLKCTSCQHETPGWDMKAIAEPQVIETRGFIRLPLFGERRVQ